MDKIKYFAMRYHNIMKYPTLVLTPIAFIGVLCYEKEQNPAKTLPCHLAESPRYMYCSASTIYGMPFFLFSHIGKRLLGTTTQSENEKREE